MAVNVVLTGVGHDRVGIVAELSKILYELGCNLLDSSMTLLRSEFAVILMAQIPDGKSIDDLKERLAAAEERLGMSVFVRELSEEELDEEDEDAEAFIVSVYGADRPGIVAGITAELARLGVNLTDVETRKTPGDRPIFMMVLEVTLPPGLSGDSLKSELQTVAAELQVDLSVNSVEVADL